jgi:hypothetical protein
MAVRISPTPRPAPVRRTLTRLEVQQRSEDSNKDGGRAAQDDSEVHPPVEPDLLLCNDELLIPIKPQIFVDTEGTTSSINIVFEYCCDRI